MNKYALYINDEFQHIRQFESRPDDIPHKDVKWYPVVEEYGEPYVGLENGNHVIRTIDPSTLPPVPPESISDRQFFHILALNGSITEEEALAAVKVGDIPATLMALIQQLPEGDKFNAEMLLSGATVFQRYHPLTDMLGAAMGYTTEQIDELFIAAEQL